MSEPIPVPPGSGWGPQQIVSGFLAANAKKPGVKTTKSGGQRRGPCPICKHRSQRCFVITPSKNLYYCFGDCKEGGDALQLVARIGFTR